MPRFSFAVPNSPAILSWFSCLVFLIPAQTVSAQNLFPNGDFEDYSLCPSGYNQTNYLNGWSAGNSSADYFNCSYYGTLTQGVPASGTGLIGFWGGSNHPACTGLAYAESIIGSLAVPLVSGSSYTVSFQLQIDNLGSVSAGPNGCMDFGFYFYESSNPPATASICCYSIQPQVSVSGNSLQAGTYTPFTLLFTPTANYDRVMIGTFCNTLTSTAACANYANNRMYFNLDDISLEAATVLPAEPVIAAPAQVLPPSIGNFSPNPLHEAGTIPLELESASRVVLSLTDLTGHRILSQTQQLSSGTHTLSLDVSGYSPGIYLIRTDVYQAGRSRSRVEKLHLF